MWLTREGVADGKWTRGDRSTFVPRTDGGPALITHKVSYSYVYNASRWITFLVT